MGNFNAIYLEFINNGLEVNSRIMLEISFSFNCCMFLSVFCDFFVLFVV